MKKILLIGLLGIFLFAPIWSQNLSGVKVYYSTWDTIEMDISEHQLLFPGIE